MRLALVFVVLGALCAGGCKGGDAAGDASPAADGTGPDDAAGSDAPVGGDEDQADDAINPDQTAADDAAGDPAPADSAPEADANSAGDSGYEPGLPPADIPAFEPDGCWWYLQCVRGCAPGDAGCRAGCAAGLSDVVSGVAPAVAECVETEGCWNADGALDPICLIVNCKDTYHQCYYDAPEGTCLGHWACKYHCAYDEETEGVEWASCVMEHCPLDEGPAGADASFDLMVCESSACPGCLVVDPPPECARCSVEALCGVCKDKTGKCFGHLGSRGCLWDYQCHARCLGLGETQQMPCILHCDSMTSLDADCAVRRIRACILEACEGAPECLEDRWCPCAQAAMNGECKDLWEACLAVPDGK